MEENYSKIGVIMAKTTKLPKQKLEKMMVQKARKMMKALGAPKAPKPKGATVKIYWQRQAEDPRPYGGVKQHDPSKPMPEGYAATPPTKEVEGMVKPEGEAKKEETKEAKPEAAKEAPKQTIESVYSPNTVIPKEQISPDLPNGMKQLNERLSAIDNDPNISQSIKNLSKIIKLEANKQANAISPDKTYNDVIEAEFDDYIAKQKAQRQKMADQAAKMKISTTTDLDELRGIEDTAMQNNDVKTVALVRKRIEGITAIEMEKEEKNLQQRYAKEIDEELAKDVPEESIKGKVLTNIKPEIVKIATEGYTKFLINEDRKADGLPEITNIDEYYNGIKDDIDVFMNNTGIKGYDIDTQNSTVVIKGATVEDLVQQRKQIDSTIGELDDVGYESKILGAKGKLQLVVRFTKLGDTKIYKPSKGSAIDAAVAIANASESGDRTAKRFTGFKNGKASLQEIKGQAGQNAKMIFAGAGKGKTENIEGSIMANLQGNADGTYKAVVVDPTGSIFEVLRKDDSALSPADLAHKNKLKKWIAEGRLAVFSENVQATKNIKGFLKMAMGHIDKERAIQSKKREKYGVGNIPCVDIHIDELNLISQEVKGDRETSTRFYKMCSGLGNNDKRKNSMPVTFYAQKPTLEMKHNMNVQFDAIGSIGSANASSIASTYQLPRGSRDGFNNSASNELVMFDVNDGAMQYYDQMVVGNAIKRGFGQIGEATK